MYGQHTDEQGSTQRMAQQSDPDKVTLRYWLKMKKKRKRKKSKTTTIEDL